MSCILLPHLQSYPKYVNPCKQNISVWKNSLTGEYEDMFLSYIIPYFQYPIAYEINFLHFLVLHYVERRRNL